MKKSILLFILTLFLFSDSGLVAMKREPGKKLLDESRFKARKKGILRDCFPSNGKPPFEDFLKKAELERKLKLDGRAFFIWQDCEEFLVKEKDLFEGVSDLFRSSMFFCSRLEEEEKKGHTICEINLLEKNITSLEMLFYRIKLAKEYYSKELSLSEAIGEKNDSKSIKEEVAGLRKTITGFETQLRCVKNKYQLLISENIKVRNNLSKKSFSDRKKIFNLACECCLNRDTNVANYYFLRRHNFLDNEFSLDRKAIYEHFFELYGKLVFLEEDKYEEARKALDDGNYKYFQQSGEEEVYVN